MVHPKLMVYSDDRTIDYTIDWQYINHGIIKNIGQLNKGINASSSTAEVTLSHDSPYTLPILECEKDLHAILYETVSGTNVPHFTGYVSQDFTWVVDSHGARAVKITLEDNGTKLLKKPYTTTDSVLIKGTASACIASICSRVGITPTSSTLNINTPVRTIAENGETCQELLTSLCRELGYSYYFNVSGQLELKKLSTDNLSGVTTVNDTDLYDSIKLSKQARQYKGSRITYKALKDRAGALIYRDITNQSSSHKDCWVELSANEYYPSGADANNDVKIDCVDLNEGKDIYSIDANSLTPTVTWARGTGTSSVTLSGANTLAVKLQCTSTESFNKAVVSKLQATADITYVDSTEIIYGNGEVGSEDYYECDCRWLHTKTPAVEFANFVAQYYQFCSREFTFKSKSQFSLGQIIKLHENLFSDLETYLIISTIKKTDSTQIMTYTANSISAFNYSKQTTDSSTSAPPSTVYVEIPDVELENITTEITASPEIFYSDQRDSSSGQVNLKYYYNASTTVPDTVVWDVKDNYNNSITLTYDNASHSEAHFSLAKKTTATYIIAKAYVTGVQSVTSQEKTINIIDNTVYNKNWGTITSLPSNDQVLNGDYFLAGSGLSGYTYGVPYVRVSGSWTQLTGNSVDNVQRLLNTLGSALNSDLTVPATSALYAWFGTLIAQDAVITNLFSKNITLLSNGSIHSAAYDDTGTYVGPGAGFWLGADGTLKCETSEINNANAVDLNISGNSSFHGSFDCSIIKTTPEDPSTYITLSPVGADGAQCKRIVDRLFNNGLIPDWAGSAQASGMIPISVVGVSDIAFMKVTYQKGTRSGTTTYYARVNFYNSSGTELNVRDYSVLNVSKSSSGSWANYLYSSNLNSGDLTNIPGEYAAQAGSTDGITIRVLTGQSRLWMSLPTANEATALTSGMLFRSVNPVATGTTGVTGYSVFMKP